MRKLCALLSVFLILLLLTGCACQHEWTQPDCQNPAVCTKCQETGAEALGHDWADATCQSPQTCLRCSETQGGPVPHDFQDWTFDPEAEQMHRTCSDCGYEEHADLDRAAYLDTLLQGCWEFSMLLRGDGSYYSGYSFNEPMDQLFFGEQHQVTGSVAMEPFEGTWEFQEFNSEEDAALYSFLIPNTQDKVLPAMLVVGDDTAYLYLYYNESDTAVLQRHDEAAAALSGTWGAESSSMYSLTLNPDRTVTGNIDGEFTGTWQLLDTLDHELLGEYCGLYIRFQRNGEEILLHGTATPDYLYGDTPAAEFQPTTISFTYGKTKLEFTPMSQEEIETRQEQMSEGPNMLIGTWSSMYFRSFDVQPNRDTLALDYTVTFLSDGTFTASVGKEIQGTWEYADSRGDKTSGRHSYYFYIEGDPYPYDMDVEYTETHVPQLRMESKSTVPGSRRMLFLNKRTSQQDQTARSLIGNWTSMYVDEPNAGNDRINTMEYSFTFHENGTFSGNDGSDVNGTWIYERTRDETVHQFSLIFNGQALEGASITMYDHSESGDETKIEYRISTDSGMRYIWLIQLTEEDLEKAQLGPTYVLGKWQDDEGNSITVLEDGTFTANLDTVIQGTWSFRRYKPGSGFWYDFTFPGQSQYCDKTMYGHPDENTLTFRIETEDSENFYSMHRSQ